MQHNHSTARPATAGRQTGASSDCSTPLRCALDALDYAHAGDSIGFDRGRSQGQLEVSVDLARQWLLNLARDDEYIATGVARSRHGSGWESLIRAQSRGEDW